MQDNIYSPKPSAAQVDNGVRHIPIDELQAAPDAVVDARLGSDGMTYPIAFFHVISNEENGNMVGGLLVSDNTGVPMEFVITNAVKPTPAQRILYGKRLKSYAAIELCAKQLLQHVKTRPRVYFVQNDLLLGISAITETPVLKLTSAEQFGTTIPSPAVVAPDSNPEYANCIDIRSLDADMLDGFRRIELCREILAKTKPEYQL
jgi:hypothetical protein